MGPSVPLTGAIRSPYSALIVGRGPRALVVKFLGVILRIYEHDIRTLTERG